jgi:hypothetical protein
MAKFFTTGLIWMLYAGMATGIFAIGSSPSSSVSEWAVVGLILLFTILTAYATRVIWQAEALAGKSSARQTGQGAYKAKRDRTDRVSRLVEQMDDDELIELETLLAASREEDARM